MKPIDLGLRVALILVALVLVPAGIAKVFGVPQMHASFATLGLPHWFGYFIGTCEIAGAVALFMPRFSIAAACGVCIIMLGAIYFHLAHTPPVQGIPALIVFVLCVFIISRRRKARSEG